MHRVVKQMQHFDMLLCEMFHQALTLFLSFLRAPVLVALALIESGMKYEDAVEFIRR